MGGVRSPPRGPMSLTGSDVSQSIVKNYFLMLQYRFIHWTGTSNIIILTVLRGNFMKFLKPVYDFRIYSYNFYIISIRKSSICNTCNPLRHMGVEGGDISCQEY